MNETTVIGEPGPRIVTTTTRLPRTPLVRVLYAARCREEARVNLRDAIFAAKADGATQRQIAIAAGVSKRYVQLVLAGERLKAQP